MSSDLRIFSTKDEFEEKQKKCREIQIESVKFYSYFIDHQFFDYRPSRYPIVLNFRTK